MATTNTLDAQKLLENSKAAILAAIEIHNKPIFSYRYEVCVLLKAYINNYLSHVNLFEKDGTTKPFKECLSCIGSSLGNDFKIIKSSIEALYEYRNGIAHFYPQTLTPILYSILRPNIIFYADFAKKFFQVDLSKEVNLALLPISFQKPFSPVDFLTNKSTIENESQEVKNFIESLINSVKSLHEDGIEDSILVEYRMHLSNETRIKNADIIAGISNRPEIDNSLTVVQSLSNFTPSNAPDAKFVHLAEQDMRKYYPHSYAKVQSTSRAIFVDFRAGPTFNQIIRTAKGNNKLHYVKILDPGNPKSARKDWYSWAIYTELAKHYQVLNGIDLEKLHEDNRF